jgi:hypothetical protein
MPGFERHCDKMCAVVKNCGAVAVLEGEKAGLLVEQVAYALGSRTVGGVPGDKEATADRGARSEGEGGGDPLFLESER